MEWRRQYHIIFVTCTDGVIQFNHFNKLKFVNSNLFQLHLNIFLLLLQNFKETFKRGMHVRNYEHKQRSTNVLLSCNWESRTQNGVIGQIQFRSLARRDFDGKWSTAPCRNKMSPLIWGCHWGLIRVTVIISIIRVA